LYLHDHQNGFFFKRIQFYNDNFPCPWSLFVRGHRLPVADEKRVYKTIPAMASTEASATVKCRNGNNDDRNGPEIPEIKKTSIGNSNKNTRVGRLFNESVGEGK
jgi:hypothetical protein